MVAIRHLMGLFHSHREESAPLLGACSGLSPARIAFRWKVRVLSAVSVAEAQGDRRRVAVGEGRRSLATCSFEFSVPVGRGDDRRP